MSDSKTLVLIDAMSLAYKAYFTFINRPLNTSTGEPTSAVYGFLTQLFKIIEDTNPEFIAVAFDSKEKTFRHEMYEKYKSSREEMPEDMIPQIDRIKQIIEAFNIPMYIKEGFEADDLIGTACRLAEEEGYNAFAITPDKDYIQLITKKTRLIKPGRSTDEIVIIDKDKVEKDYGFEPRQMIDYLALVGDSSDDIPGVKGVGPKTTAPLIRDFKTVENIYENIDKIEKKGVRTKLESDKDKALLSKELATIKTDVDFDFDIKKTKFEEPDIDRLLKIFTELEFKSFGNKVIELFNPEQYDQSEVEQMMEETSENDIQTFDKSKVSYKLITTEDEAKKLAEDLAKYELVVFDTETDSLNVRNLHLAGASFSVKPKEAYFVAVNPTKRSGDLFSKDISDRLEVDTFVKHFKPVFENSDIKKVCQNGKYDIAVLRNYGIELKNFYFDTMLASYVLDSDQKHGMDDLSEKYLNYRPVSIMELIGSKKTPEKIFEADVNKLSDYACEDADITYRLYKILSENIEEESLEKIAYDVEFPLVQVLENMERTGVNVNKQSLNELSSKLEKMMEGYTEGLHKLAGKEFNVNSTQQLQKVLFEDLNLTKTKKTKTGYSTDARSLESLQGEHEIIRKILDYRQVSKLKSTYADALPSLTHHRTGRIHTTFNQTVASTGRLSSIDPNLQNIPIRTELGKEIRKAFVASNDDYTILSADYSQIELRIMASICGDEALLEAFMNGEDIHRSTAASVFMVKPEEVIDDMRRKAKEVNFGILYGIGPFGLKIRLGISHQHAKEIIDTYFNTFTKVRDYIEDSKKAAREKGYAETLMGRRRYLKNINSKNRTIRQSEERIAINMPIQGTAADMIKLAMINVHNQLVKRKSKTKMVLQVHDELLFDAHKDEIDELVPVIKDEMSNAMSLDVPIDVEWGTGKNWLEAH